MRTRGGVFLEHEDISGAAFFARVLRVMIHGHFLMPRSDENG